MVVVTGCREDLVSSDPILVDPTPTPASLLPLYVKGEATLRVDDHANYRAEPLPGLEVDRYRWGFHGEGALSAQPNDPTGRDRLIRSRALRAGPVTLYVRAYDAEGNTLAYGEKAIEITPY